MFLVKSITLAGTHSVLAQNNISIPNSPMHYSPDNNDGGTVTVTGEDEIKLIGHPPPPRSWYYAACEMKTQDNHPVATLHVSMTLACPTTH